MDICNLMHFKFYTRPFLILTFGFILFTAIGTVSHEYGHIAVAKFHGYETELHYGSMNYYPPGYKQDEDYLTLKKLYAEHQNIKFSDWPESETAKRIEYIELLQNRYWNDGAKDDLFICMAGSCPNRIDGNFRIDSFILS